MLSPASRKPPRHRTTPSLNTEATAPRSPTPLSLQHAATPLLSALNSPIQVQVKASTHTPNNLVLACIYGLINTVLTVPCMYGYALIIFSDPFFTAYTPQLCKLVLFSSAIHQIVFSLTSSLPFAIGQVQDAGLLFLHAIATNIVKQGIEQQWEDVEIIATVVVGLAVSTSLLGVALLLIGKLKLASLVSYLPAPVVGGYLAFIGYFCLLSGLNLCTGLVFNANVNDAASFSTLFHSERMIVLTIPGLLGGALLLIVASKSQHVAALPCAILGMPIAFYVVTWCSGMSMETVRHDGWINPLSNTTTSYVDVLHLFQFEHVQWSVLPSQCWTWLSMTFVVSFSSCLDVAAIEMDIGKQLKINHELMTVGLSNVISGLLGGFTGSYIFSQTIFTARTNVNSRVIGLVVILSELALFLSPISIMSYVPKFFFAATLVFIAFDLMLEWLYFMYWKLLFREYLIVLGTLTLIILFGLQVGMLLSIGLAGIAFVWSYSRTSKLSVQVLTTQSNVLATHDDRLRREQAHREIRTLTLHGYIFFGSAKNIVNDVLHNVHVYRQLGRPCVVSNNVQQRDGDGGGGGGGGRSVEGKREGMLDEDSLSILPQPQWKTSSYQSVQSRARILHDRTQKGAVVTLLECMEAEKTGKTSSVQNDTTVEDGQMMLPTRVLLLNFSRCHGMDATAVKSCFSVLDQLCTQHQVTVICCGASAEVSFLLNANGLSQWRPGEFDTVEEAVVWAEEHVQERSEYVNRPSVLHGREGLNLLKRAPSGKERTPSFVAKHDGMVAAHVLKMAKCDHSVSEKEKGLLVDGEEYFVKLTGLKKKHMLYQVGDASDAMYIVSEGSVSLLCGNQSYKENGIDSRSSVLKSRRSGTNNDGTRGSSTCSSSSGGGSRSSDAAISVKAGFIFGDSEFVLAMKRTHDAVVSKDQTVLWRLERKDWIRMEQERPDVYHVYQKMLVRVLAHQVNWATNF